MTNLIDRDVLATKVAQYRQEGRRVGLAVGTFNPPRIYPPHDHHGQMLTDARDYLGKHGVLVIAINDDPSLMDYRGSNGHKIIRLPEKDEIMVYLEANRSIDPANIYKYLLERFVPSALNGQTNEYYPFPAAWRAKSLRQLPCVSHVVAFPEPTAVRTIELLGPDLLIKGKDYTIGTINQDECRAMGSNKNIAFAGNGTKAGGNDIRRHVELYFKDQLEGWFI